MIIILSKRIPGHHIIIALVIVEVTIYDGMNDVVLIDVVIMFIYIPECV
jgi:hypothetical protein